MPVDRSLGASAGRVNWRRQSFRGSPSVRESVTAARSPEGRAYLPSLLAVECIRSAAATLLPPYFVACRLRSGFFRLPSRTEGQQLSRNPPALQRLIGTAKAFCLIEQWPDSQPLRRAGALNYLAEARRGNLKNSFL